MRVFLAGASGAIGRYLVPMLCAEGHQVTAMTRSPEKLEALRSDGAEPVLADALDAQAVSAAVSRARPEAVIHQLTALPARIDPRKIERDLQANDRLRSEGTGILVDAAKAAGAGRIVAQSVAFFYAPGPAGTVHAEADPLLLDDAPKAIRRSARALRQLERTVLDADGVVLRYGYFYGAGSAVSSDGSMAEDLRRRRLPIVGGGQGVWSFIHLEDAARATVAALTQGRARRYLRTTSTTPTTSSARPSTREKPTCCLATPSRPKRSTATEIASWPVITTAVSPLAPSVRTATSATDTYTAPSSPPTSAHQGTSRT